MMVLIFDWRNGELAEKTKCITLSLIRILISGQQNDGPDIWWKEGGVGWNSQVYNSDFVCNINLWSTE